MNEHALDAAGLAAWLVRPEPVKRAREARSRAPGEKVPRRPSAAAREKAEAERARREAAGCTCKGKHRRECPLFVSSAGKKLARLVMPNIPSFTR